MTNSNLIPVFNGTIALQPTQLCNARELHQFVESQQDFSHWIKNRIDEYGFVENEDYIKITVRTGGRGRAKIEYHITIDMGKELGMLEKNAKGREIRKYFILCERKAKEAEKRLREQPQQLALPEPEKKYTFEFTEYELEQLSWLSFSHKQMNELLGLLIQPLEALGSRYCASVYSHHHEYKRHYTESLDTIKRLTEPFKKSDRLNWKRVIHRLTA
ncbi:antA/AntB antirepressor family protein [Ursidibacter arcticus]